MNARSILASGLSIETLHWQILSIGGRGSVFFAVH